jgi:hypothetical protein
VQLNWASLTILSGCRDIRKTVNELNRIHQESNAMSSSETAEVHRSHELSGQVTEDTIAQLVGQVYESVPPAVQSRLIECLLKPLGVLSLVSVANGIFADIVLRGDWQQRRILPEDAQNVQVSDVISLVSHVQQVSVCAVNGLTSILAASPMMTGSAAAAVLMTVLLQRTKARRASDRRVDDSRAVANPG